MRLDFREKFWIFPQKFVKAYHGRIYQMFLLSIIKADQINHQCFRYFRQSQSNLSKNMYCFSCNLYIHIMGVFIEFIKHISQVILIGKHSKDLHFDILDISWFVNFTVKILKILFVLVFTIHVLYHIFDVLQNDKCAFIRPIAFTCTH